MEKSFSAPGNGPRRPTASVQTLGCKVNQFESAAISRKLEEEGFILVEKGMSADVVVVNTCTVTHRADFEARALVRRAFRANPGVRAVVTGCLAQVKPAELAALPGVSLVLGQHFKADIVRLLAEPHPGKILVSPWSRGQPILDLGFPSFDRSRAFFRIQDGCNGGCSYCIVPKSRGPSRSLPPETVFQGLEHYFLEGRAEVVLTGIHLGSWGLDLDPSRDFFSLLLELEGRPGSRLRLSSIEPNEVTDQILQLVKNSARFCPHLHLPLQSGSDLVLAAMHRPYSSDFFRELVQRAAFGRPDFCLGVDVLVGFPGETDADFERTRDLLAEAPISYLHVFPYSRRPGTAAATDPNQIPAATAKSRVGILRKLGLMKRQEFNSRCRGQVRPALVENSRDKASGLAKGLTDNYIPVLLPDPAPPAGAVIPVEILGPTKGVLMMGRPA
ncbi:MAG: tRNA (N(6)-L-threonylcarbamoyladenosine(37)-C(2))-methylthiotransferase MtaB [Pseudomonadota bacterium]